MTRRTLKKIVKITGMIIIIALTTALTSCNTNTAQFTRAHNHDTEFGFHSFITNVDFSTSFSEMWKLS